MCFVCICIRICLYPGLLIIWTRSTVLRRTLSAAADRSLAFSKHIFKFPLFFSFQKIAYIDYYVLQVR